MDAGQPEFYQENAFLECHLQQGGLETCILVQAPIQDDIWVDAWKTRWEDDEDGGWSCLVKILDITVVAFVHLLIPIGVISTWRLPSSSLLVDPDEEKAEEIWKMPCRWYHRKRSHYSNPNRYRKWTMKSGAGFLCGRGFALKRSLFKRCGCQPKNRGSYPPKSSILRGFSMINHPFWGVSRYFWKHPCGKHW